MVQQAEKDLLLHLVLFPELAKRAITVGRNGIALFDEIRAPAYKQIWDLFQVLAVRIRSLEVTKRTQLGAYVELYKTGVPEEQKPEVLDFIRTLSETPADTLKEQEGRAFLDAFIERDTNRKLMTILQTTPTPEGVKKAQAVLDKQGALIKTGPSTMAEAGLFNPFQNMGQYLGTTKKIPFGVDFLDEMLHGGFSPGTSIAVIGPTGGGKTFLAVNVAFAQMLQRNNVLWCTYEQPLTGDIAERLTAKSTGIALPDVRGKTLDQLSDNGVQRLMDIQEQFGAYMTMRDFSQPLRDAQGNLLPDEMQRLGTANDIIEAAEVMISAGKKPVMLIVDWLGEMVSLIAGAINKDLVKDFQSIAMTELSVLQNWCRSNNVTLLLFHQLNAELNSAPPFRVPQKNDGMYWKGLPTKMDETLIMGTMRSSQVCLIASGKNRTGIPTVRKIRLDGDNVRFVSAEHWVQGPNGDFMDPDEEPPDVHEEEKEDARKEIEGAYDTARTEVYTF